jgi:hypothetical protein
MTSAPTPADWLLAEYDATDIEEFIECPEPVLPRRIFTLKSVMDPGCPMRVSTSDHQDPDRCWL